jgi:hypothetical protein
MLSCIAPSYNEIFLSQVPCGLNEGTIDIFDLLCFLRVSPTPCLCLCVLSENVRETQNADFYTFVCQQITYLHPLFEPMKSL